MDGSDRIIAYRATEPDSPCGSWTLSIHMPRWASRLTLRLTDVRVERVQDISKVDATAEGFEKEAALPIDPRDWFRNSWDSLNAKHGYGWDANPWVWVLVFEVIRKNVDEVL